jgi:voltage-gated potassium channel
MKLQFPRKYLKLMTLISMFIGVIIGGTLGFMILENLRVDEAFHLTIGTITTAGGTDVTLRTAGGKYFSDFLMIFGIGVGFYSFSQIIDLVVSGKLREMFKMVDYEGMVAKVKDHVIVCGFGRVGQAAVESLRRQGIEVVVLDRKEEMLKDLDKSVPRIIGDSTKDEDLVRAGIGRARVVLVTYGQDADAIMTVVTVKYMKPSLLTVVRAENQENIDKMYKVGADSVISPELEGGKSMSNVACVSFGKGTIECATAPVPPSPQARPK